MAFFGRPGGPARMVLAAVAVTVLGLLSFVVFNLDTRLDNQQRANEASIAASDSIVAVNDKLTKRLAQLAQLTATARTALNETAALGPLLVQLRDAVAPAAEMVAKGTAGGQVSNAQLTTIQNVLDQVRDKVLPLVTAASGFGKQGTQLVGVVRGLIGDLQGAIAAAKRINATLPLPG